MLAELLTECRCICNCKFFRQFETFDATATIEPRLSDTTVGNPTFIYFFLLLIRSLADGLPTDSTLAQRNTAHFSFRFIRFYFVVRKRWSEACMAQTEWFAFCWRCKLTAQAHITRSSNCCGWMISELNRFDWCAKSSSPCSIALFSFKEFSRTNYCLSLRLHRYPHYVVWFNCFCETKLEFICEKSIRKVCKTVSIVSGILSMLLSEKSINKETYWPVPIEWTQQYVALFIGICRIRFLCDSNIFSENWMCSMKILPTIFDAISALKHAILAFFMENISTHAKIQVPIFQHFEAEYFQIFLNERGS